MNTRILTTLTSAAVLLACTAVYAEFPTPRTTLYPTPRLGGAGYQLRYDPTPPPTSYLGFVGRFWPGRGVEVLSVDPGTVASQIGLEPGDTILSVNGTAITSQWQYRQVLDAAQQFSGGQVQLLVDNVRGRFDPYRQRYVSVTTNLNSAPIAPAISYSTARTSS